MMNVNRQLGFDLIQLANNNCYFSKYMINLTSFLVQSQSIKSKISSSFVDFKETAGSALGHYFCQVLVSSKWIYKSRPGNHLDVCSGIDGRAIYQLHKFQRKNRNV
jgi:hypothetical protein